MVVLMGVSITALFSTNYEFAKSAPLLLSDEAWAIPHRQEDKNIMSIREQAIEESTPFTGASPILLSGDDPRTACVLNQVLQELGFHTQFAMNFRQVEAVWRDSRNSSPAPVMVLLEVTQQRNVEAAVDTALQLKREDPSQFVGYIADPTLLAGGLIGDAVLPRNPGRLAESLREYLKRPPEPIFDPAII